MEPDKRPIIEKYSKDSNINSASNTPISSDTTIGKSQGYYNELDFLTWVKITNNDNKDDIWNRTQGAVVNNGEITPQEENVFVVYKNPENISSNKIKEHYSELHNNNDGNSYSSLIYEFGENSENGETYRAMGFHAADFAYLRDLGVYTLNRMWVLRRFPMHTVVPNNLTDWGDMTPTKPISTVVGWIKPEDESLLDIGFNETWVKTNRRLDQVLSDIMDKEFGIKTEMAVSIPGWSQGILFAFLNAMGLSSDYSSTNIPMGDPNALAEAATRLSDVSEQGQGLNTSFSLSLETTYEQKFIGDVDPGSAMLDIIENLIYMGTSDVNFVLDGSSSVINTLFAAATKDGGSDPEAWWKFIKTFVSAFFDAIKSLFRGLGKSLGFGENEKDPSSKLGTSDDTKTSYKKDKDGNITKTVKDKDGEVLEETSMTKQEYNKEVGGKSPEGQSLAAVTSQESKFGKSSSFSANSVLQTILASTVAKHRWPLIGGIGLMTGQNTTPWHLTIGNPRSPFFNVGNIVVKNVGLKFNNELGFNDIPTRVTATIDVELGRSLGAQEILSVFNNGYRRQYRKDDSGKFVPMKSYTVPASNN